MFDYWERTDELKEEDGVLLRKWVSEGYDQDNYPNWIIKEQWKEEKETYDPHQGCPAYPMCDEMPLGCIHFAGEDVEWYGHRG